MKFPFTRQGPFYEAEARGQWLDRLPERGCRFRAETLGAELDLLRALRREAKAAMLAAARKDPAYELLRTIPLPGPRARGAAPGSE